MISALVGLDQHLLFFLDFFDELLVFDEFAEVPFEVVDNFNLISSPVNGIKVSFKLIF